LNCCATSDDTAPCTQAIHSAAYVCTRTHGDAPEVTIHGRTDLHFTYVPSHISYMLLELLKNSMRATVETHGTDKMPPIKIVIADGEANEDVSAYLATACVILSVLQLVVCGYCHLFVFLTVCLVFTSLVPGGNQSI
jgi:hypothetical protein